MDGQSTASRLDNALAGYHSIVDGQLESIGELETWLRDRSTSNTRYEDVASSVYPLLASNKERLLEAKIAPASWSSPDSSPWGTIIRARTSAITVAVTITGGGFHEPLELRANSENDLVSIESFLGLLTNALDCLAATEEYISRLAQLIGVMESSLVSGSPSETVQSHIRLLGQYNDAKDIAQQLIGLIADNRGVPVGSLYQADQYGVGAND